MDRRLTTVLVHGRTIQPSPALPPAGGRGMGAYDLMLGVAVNPRRHGGTVNWPLSEQNS